MNKTLFVLFSAFLLLLTLIINTANSTPDSSSITKLETQVNAQGNPPAEKVAYDVPDYYFKGKKIPVPTLAQTNAKDAVKFLIDIFDFNDAPEGAGGGGTTTPGDDVVPPDPFTGPDTSNILCDASTKDNGVVDGWSGGKLTKIRICNVPGFGTVNSQISQQMYNLVTDAAADGLKISGGGGTYRSCEGQVSVYRRWCPQHSIPNSCPQPNAIFCPGAAKPGFSNHQMGFAIDMSCNGALIPQKHPAAGNNPCFQWLVKNARKYGLYEWGNDEKAAISASRDARGYEGWHWSVYGD